MENSKSLFDSFYTNFILRDLLAKITPGSIIFSTLFVISSKDSSSFVEFISDLTFWSSIILLGILWITGIAVQGLGEILVWIRYFPKDIDNRTFQEIRLEFLKRASDGQKQENERIIVIKEACGNTYVAIVIALFLFFLGGVIRISLHYPIFVKQNALYIPLLATLVGFVF